MSFHRSIPAALLIVTLAACGGGGNKTQSAGSANPSPSSYAAPPMGGMTKSGEAMAPGTFATIPPTLQCGAVQPVWVNTSSHVYHKPDDPYYGRTKHGQYMCPSQAKREGYRPAHGSMKSSQQDGGND